MNLIPCKLIMVPYTPKVIEAGVVFKLKQPNEFYITTKLDVEDNRTQSNIMEPVLLYLGISQPMEEYYFRDSYIEMALPPNRPVVRRVTEETINTWKLAGNEKIMQKYFKVIAKPEVVGAVFTKKIKKDNKDFNEYSVITNKHIQEIMTNDGNCFVEVKHPVKDDSEHYVLNFINNKVLIHLTNN